jgi:hypothetical protein
MNKPLRPSAILVLLVVIGLEGATALAQTGGRVAEIKRLSQKIDEEIAQSEQSPEASTLFLTELVVNKNLSPYPAVGIYKTILRFYYTFGDREKDPYPNRLLKITNSTDRSNRKEYSEFVFDEGGKLVFYFEKQDQGERRLYFAAERPIRFQQGERSLSLKNRERAVIVSAVLKEKAKLGELFRQSLSF